MCASGRESGLIFEVSTGVFSIQNHGALEGLGYALPENAVSLTGME